MNGEARGLLEISENDDTLLRFFFFFFLFSRLKLNTETSEFPVECNFDFDTTVDLEFFDIRDRCSRNLFTFCSQTKNRSMKFPFRNVKAREIQ